MNLATLGTFHASSLLSGLIVACYACRFPQIHGSILIVSSTSSQIVCHASLWKIQGA